MSDYRRGLDWKMDLLTTYTHYSELQAITAPPLITTIRKSPQHSLSFSQPAVTSPVDPWQRLLTVGILQLQAIKFSLHRLQYRNTSALTLSLAYNILARTTQKTQLFYFGIRVCCCGNVFTEPILRNGLGISAHLAVVA
jgi:hypothetical protein